MSTSLICVRLFRVLLAVFRPGYIAKNMTRVFYRQTRAKYLGAGPKSVISECSINADFPDLSVRD